MTDQLRPEAEKWLREFNAVVRGDYNTWGPTIPPDVRKVLETMLRQDDFARQLDKSFAEIRGLTGKRLYEPNPSGDSDVTHEESCPCHRCRDRHWRNCGCSMCVHRGF